jgi:A/G-specific adenine glycosylase
VARRPAAPDAPLPDARLLAAVRRALIAHYRRRARALPWRDGPAARDPYGIWVCEIMAQQTQIDRVAEYWTRWMRRFPTVHALAAAPLGDVLAAWAGLGYYARARSLHRAAALVVAEHGGRVPDDLDALLALPGVGPYTAGAIASIAHGRRAAAVDGNVARVLARIFAVDDDVRSPAGLARLWAIARALVPARAPGDFNQALFDLGATVCTPRSPSCPTCPARDLCAARKGGRQAELPRLARKTAARAVDVELALVTRRAAWLVARRAPTGLYGGLWELPEAAALGARLALDRSRALAEHVHHLSHRTMRLTVYAAKLPADARLPAPAAPYDAYRWIAPAALAELGVSSATQALAARLAAPESASNPPWPTKKEPAPSSRKATGRSSPA